MLLCFIRIGQFALFPSKGDKIQQIDLFERKNDIIDMYTSRFQKKFNQLAHNITITGFKVSMKTQITEYAFLFTTKSRPARSPFCRN